MTNEPEQKVALSLKGGNLSYSTDISPVLAAKIMTLCVSTDAGQVIAEDLGEHNTHSPNINSRTSAAEFMNQCGPKRNPDKILTLAVYLESHDSKTRFTPGEINRLFSDAGEVTPANFARDFKWTISSGWIARDTVQKNAYYVTNTGRKVLDEGFPAELVKKSSRGKSNVRRTKKSKSAKTKKNTKA